MDKEKSANLLQRMKINKLMNKYDDKLFSLINDSWEIRNIIMFYQPFYLHYNNILCGTVKLMKELKLEDPFMICQSFIYLLHSGYFSVNKEYIYRTIDLVWNKYSNGATVMTGKSKCCNNADMLKDFLRKSKIESSPVSCKTKRFCRHGHNHLITSFYDDIHDDIDMVCKKLVKENR